MNWKFDLWEIFLVVETRSEDNFSFAYHIWIKIKKVFAKSINQTNSDKINFLSIKILDLFKLGGLISLINLIFEWTENCLIEYLIYE